MGFVEGKCTKCQGILQVPEERDKIICMYCGEELLTKEIITEEAIQIKKNEEAAKEAVKGNYIEYMETILKEFPELLDKLEEPQEYLRKKLYKPAFEKFTGIHKELLNTVNKAYLLADDAEDMMTQIGKVMAEKGASLVEIEGKKRKQEDRLVDLNLALVIYIFPMLLDYKGDFGDQLCDVIIREWKEKFPKTNISKAPFEQIDAGFKRKLCYITTTLCEGMGKPDNCYELTLLRNYRDQYLVNQPGGEELVMEYYDVAPTIVKKLKKHPDKENIYAQIWDNYLKPCICLIEEDEKEKCRVHYEHMVRELQKEYVYTS